MPKYNLEFKIKIVGEYISVNIGLNSLFNKYNFEFRLERKLILIKF